MKIGAMQHALQGLQTNQRRFERAADGIVRATTTEAAEAGGEGLIGSAVELVIARRGFEACLAVAHASDEMVGSVIDVLA